MARFPMEQLAAEKPSRPLTFLDLGFGFIALLAAGFSGYTTFIGFHYDFPFPMAIVMAIIIGVGLFLITLKLREARVNGDSLTPALVAFAFFLPFSFISNSNAIYTFFLQKDIVKQTQENAWDVFDKGTAAMLASARDHSLSKQAATEREALEIAIRNLVTQVKDPANPGFGTLAQAHLREVESLLGVTITRLRPPPSSARLEAHEEYAMRLEQEIRNAMQTQARTTNSQYTTIDRFVSKTDEQRRFYRQKVLAKEWDSETTDLMRADLASLKVEAEQLFGFDVPIDDVDAFSDDIGAFNYTWRNFYNGTNMPAIILSILLSLMLDILAPILAVMLYRREDQF